MRKARGGSAIPFAERAERMKMLLDGFIEECQLEFAEKDAAWRPVTNAVPSFTPQEHFAHRLRTLLHAAFVGGVAYAEKNPAVLETRPHGARSLRELMQDPDFVGSAFAAWAYEQRDSIGASFGLEDAVLQCYFKQPE